MTDAEDREAALEKLTRFAQPEAEPTLSDTELDEILDENARAVRWTTVTALSYGTQVLPTVYNGHYYTVTTGGTTAVTEPSWTTSSKGSVTSGDVVFQEAGLFTYSSLYDVRAALRKCWELKAAKASEFHEGDENKILTHCNQMVERYTTPVIA